MLITLIFGLFTSASKAIDILEAYEGTLDDDYPPDNERCEHGEMLLYKVIPMRHSVGVLFFLSSPLMGCLELIRYNS